MPLARRRPAAYARAVIDLCVSVAQNVPKGDEPLEVPDADGRSSINLRKLSDRFTDDLELPFNRRAKHGVGEVVVEREGFVTAYVRSASTGFLRVVDHHRR